MDEGMLVYLAFLSPMKVLIVKPDYTYLAQLQWPTVVLIRTGLNFFSTFLAIVNLIGNLSS
ncbi:hypothetical protein O3M35_013322 [Rhynocoris fuscipes]|uniref:Transmembrane protein n=1 Tax=Rhynocoris fuscipes TaxID=488301 RepID=A0AAW1CDR7_9HEMI